MGDPTGANEPISTLEESINESNNPELKSEEDEEKEVQEAEDAEDEEK